MQSTHQQLLMSADTAEAAVMLSTLAFNKILRKYLPVNCQ